MDEVPAYTRDDYLTTTKPFEYLYCLLYTYNTPPDLIVSGFADAA